MAVNERFFCLQRVAAVASRRAPSTRRPAHALDAVADAERDYLKKSTEARKNVLVARATLRGLAAATNATSAENATAVIEESGLGAKVKKLMPFGGSPKSNRDDALECPRGRDQRATSRGARLSGSCGFPFT